MVLPTCLLLRQITTPWCAPSRLRKLLKSSIPIDDLGRRSAMCATAGKQCAYMTSNGQDLCFWHEGFH